MGQGMIKLAIYAVVFLAVAGLVTAAWMRFTGHYVDEGKAITCTRVEKGADCTTQPQLEAILGERDQAKREDTTARANEKAREVELAAATKSIEEQNAALKAKTDLE